MQANARLAADLNSAAIHFLRRLAREDAASGVGPTQLSALSILVFAGPQRLTDLAELERVSAPTMSRVVRGLTGAGVARRVVDPEDGRVTWIHASPAGRRVLEGARRARMAMLTKALAHLSPAERRTLASAADLLEQIARVHAP